MQAVTKRPGFVAAIHLLGQFGLLLGPVEELGRTESLRRLRRAPIDLPDDHVAVQMHVHAQLDGKMRLGMALLGLGGLLAARHDAVNQMVEGWLGHGFVLL